MASGKATLGQSLDGSNDKKNPTSMTERFYNVVQLAQSAGDYDKLVQGKNNSGPVDRPRCGFE